MAMETDDKLPYIKQQAEGENLYSRLQKQTLEEVQRLSGKVWTDFNAHSPGVTLADVGNYALTETDYKFGFDMTDYLTTDDGEFSPERFGLFLPEAVYTTAPVTPEDYRKLFFAHIPILENVWVEADEATGGYTIKVVLPPFGDTDEKAVEKQVRAVYNSHRNLCEHLDKVIFVQPEELVFHAEIEIEPGKDASVVLAKLYEAILRYLSGSVSISAPDERKLLGVSPEEWLEGSESGVRVVIPRQQDTEYELYKVLCRVEGIRSFSTCYLMKDGEPLTNFMGGFSLQIPKMAEELKVRIRCGRFAVTIDMEKFTEQLKTLYFIKGRTREKNMGKVGDGTEIPEGEYRNVFSHHPIEKDFPMCYNLSANHELPTSFEAYLKLYDKVVTDGLGELKELPRALSIRQEEENDSFGRDIYTLKSRYLDFLDPLYGVDSWPEWLKESDCYGETTDETLRRRMAFLRHIACLAKNRAQARNITLPEGEHNAPVAKEWFCRLLGINGDEEHTVSNVLPAHNLRVVDKKSDKPLFDRLDALLIDERMLKQENVIPVIYEKLATDEKEKHEEYSRLRVELPIFNDNRISGDLFRNGSCLENYKIVQAAKDEYMLVLRNREKSGWTNLGRTDNKERLNTLANIMRRYLRELNLECETVYIVEPVLVDPCQSFRLLIVLPAWTLRFHSPRFRDMCRELLRSIIPAHLPGRIYWLDERTMQGFEKGYRQLMRALTDNDLANYSGQLLEAMYELLDKAVEKQILDDYY